MSRTLIARRATRALTPTGGFLRGFAFTLNPYIGCAFGAAGGCPFCYVRALPVAHAADGPWGNWVVAKTNLPELLERELRKLESAGKLRDATIFMSSATDPYQGYERTLRLTRRALELFVRFRPRRILLQTRSPLIERDRELLGELGANLVVSLTIETDDETVRRALTPTSAAIARRFTTVRRLRAAGIFTQIAIAPMMPNHAERFAALVAEAANRVIVDTYFAGDGAHGRRSRALGIGELYRRLGYEGWFAPGAESALLAALRARLGDDRVLFSGDGFNAV
ncbi:MAG: radical SAM protein [Candidatus Binataceae bacterium]